MERIWFQAMTLQASWKRTIKHLQDARRELPACPLPGDEGGSASAFQEFLEHNEFELALDELEAMAATNSTTTHFWLGLHAAAKEMNLRVHEDRYAKILDRIGSEIDIGRSSQNFPGITWRGESINDIGLLGELPSSLVRVLREVNGFVLHGGAVHIRGACMMPEWHSLRAAMQGPAAFHKLYESVHVGDIPFGQDQFGDQFLLRGDRVLKLSAESGEVEPLADTLDDFVHRMLEDTEEFLNVSFQHAMQPGQLLLAAPPFVFKESATGVSLKPVSAAEVILFHADLARQIRDVPEGCQVKIKVRP